MNDQPLAQAPTTERAPTTQPPMPLPTAAHIYGVSALLLAGFGVPAIWLISGAERLDKSDRWVLRGVATATALIAAPLAAAYITRSVNR